MIRAPILFALGCALLLADRGRADKPAADAKPSANDLSMEVAALRALYQFHLTPDQMKSLRTIAAKCADKSKDREEAKASAKFTKALQNLRAALAEASDDDAIAKAEDEVTEIHDAEEPELDDEVEITAEARARTPDAMRLLKAPQLTRWLAANAEAIADPRDLLQMALAKVRTLKGEEFIALREEVAEEAGRLLAGVQAKKAERIHDTVFGLLTRAHDLTDDEAAKKLPELEKEVEQLIGRTTATDVIRHVVELAVAELLSNPRLPAAIDARLTK